MVTRQRGTGFGCGWVSASSSVPRNALLFHLRCEPANRAAINVIKSRVNLQLSLDGNTSKSTNEAVIMDPTGKILATIAGGTGTAVRLSLETSADYCH